jgi:signal peptidase I
MPLSNYPNGFASGVTIRGVPILQTNPGQVYWVSNSTALLGRARNGSDGNRGTFDSPFATLNYAVTQCVANRGDIIVIKPGHVETVSTATALALNIAGVAIVGLGAGTNRPKFTLDTANTATIPVSANNISIQNCQFFANFLSIAACFTLTTAKEFAVQNCLFQDTSSVLNFLNIVKSTGAANTVDGLTFSDNVVINLGVTSNNTTILTANDIDRLTMQRNYLKWAVQNDKAIGVIVTAGVLTNLVATDNMGYRPNTTTAGGSFINVGGTTSTGIVARNLIQTLTTTTDLLFTTSVGLGAFDNRVTGVVGASGFLIPAADS